MKLLIIDDDVILTKSMKRFYDTQFEKVDVANSVTDGIQMLERHNYDAIITDWDCPSPGEGRKIVKTANELGIPVVVYTGDVTVVSENVIYKPSDNNEITNALYKASKGERNVTP